jgi:O-antigen ligase
MSRDAVLIGAVVAIVLSPSFLGGGAGGWSQALPIFGIGILLLAAPFRLLPDRATAFGLAGLVVCAALSFLPFRFLGISWRSDLQSLVSGFGWTVSLQPTWSCICYSLLVGVTLFALWLIQWQPVDRVLCLQWMTIGIAFLGLVALMQLELGFPIPIWHPAQGFGPFPNRNQTGALMGLGAMLSLGLLGADLDCRRVTSLIWAFCFAACTLAAFFSNSRAALALLVVGMVIWLAVRFGVTLKAAAVAAGATLLVAAFGCVMRPDFVARLCDLAGQGVGFRGKIYADAVRLISSCPLTGVGLGNFAVVFPLFRESSLTTERVIHPESDWLWLTSEAGILSVACCLFITLNLLVQRAKPTERHEKGVLLAGLIATLVLLVNSIVDVPGHRLGTFLPMLMVGALCTAPKCTPYRCAPWVSRFAGVVVIGIGGFLIWQNISADERVSPSWDTMRLSAARALAITPADWELRLRGAVADVHLHRWTEALSDFRAARTLEPKLALVPLDQGLAWLPFMPALTEEAWREALMRASTEEERKEIFSIMLSRSEEFPVVHQSVVRWADHDLALALVALRSGYGDVGTLESIEQKSPKLTPAEQITVTQGKARQAAGRQDYQRAYQLYRETLNTITFPRETDQTEEQCRLALERTSSDFGAAFRLCRLLRQRANEELALLENVLKEPGCPQYFWVIKADALAGRGDWMGAWEAIRSVTIRK